MRASRAVVMVVVMVVDEGYVGLRRRAYKSRDDL